MVRNKAFEAFLDRRTQAGAQHGFAPLWMPDFLFPFQQHLVDWAIRRGRAAIFADCGLGKTPMQLVWAQNVIQKTNKPVLILTPLAVGQQTLREAEKFSIAAERSRDGCSRGDRIVITNYEKLHLFDSTTFAGVVCDESSILKHFSGATQKAVTRFMLKVPYRLLCTATAAPNDYIELGTSSEALGELGYMDMVTRFFKQVSPQHRLRMIKNTDRNSNSFHVAQYGQFRFKGHAVLPFWRWIASWARACRRPSDLGFDNDGFILPPLLENGHVVEPTRAADGMLFIMPAVGLREEREERRRTLIERCEFIARLVDHDRAAVVWCHLNVEGDFLARLIPGAVQVRGADSDDAKEEAYRAFVAGSLRVIVTKPKIGAWGLNWQHCNHVVTFASHSYEQFYQSVRRCWRFGQTQPVTVDIVSTTGELQVRKNMQRKAEAMDKMFTALIAEMYTAQTTIRTSEGNQIPEVPSWA